MSPSDFSGTSTGSGDVSVGDLPTTVPTSFYAQAQGDMLNQQAAADTAATQFQAQVLNDHLNTTAAIQQLDQGSKVIGKANQYIGSTAWGSGHNTYCETFAEQMTDGQNMGGSAYDAFGNRLKAGQAVADPSLQGVQPGDLVYFGRAGENGGFGHVGVYTGNGRITSATVNGIQNYPISAFNAPVVGYAKTGSPGGVNTDTGTSAGAVPAPPTPAKMEGGDNPPPPDFSGGSWAPPSLDSFKNWLGSVTDKIMSGAGAVHNGLEQAGVVSGSEPVPLANELGSVAQNIGQAYQSANEHPEDAGTFAGAAAAGNPLDPLANVRPGFDNPQAADAGGPTFSLGDVANTLSTAIPGPHAAEAAAPAVNEAITQGAEKLGQLLPRELGGSALSGVALERRGIPGIVGASEDLGNNINLAHLPQDVAAPIESTYERNAPAIDAARRGVVPNTQTVADAQDLANATGSPVQDVIAKWQPGDVQNAAMMTAVRNALVDAKRTALDAAEAWGANPTPSNQMAKQIAGAQADRVQMVASGLTAELGRGLQAMGIDVTDPLIVSKLANNSDFLSAISRPNLKPGDLPAAIGGQGGQKFSSNIYHPSADNPLIQSNPVQQDFLPGLEPPAIGGNTVEAVSKPFAGEAGTAADIASLNEGKQYPVWQTSGPDFGPQGAPLFGGKLQGLQDIQNLNKQILVSLSVFHPVVENYQLGRTFLSQGDLKGGVQALADANHAFFSPKFMEGWQQANRLDLQRAEGFGTTMLRGEQNPDNAIVGNVLARSLIGGTASGLAGFGSAKAQGESTEDALKRAGIAAAGGLAAGALAKPINEALWGRFVPVAKLSAFKLLEDKYGGEAAAEAVNNIFGGQNLAKLGRTKQFQDAFRLVALAPDWLESWARNTGAVVMPGPVGDISRRFMLATLGAGMLTLEGLNMAFNDGHTTFDNAPGHRFELRTTGLYQKLGMNPTQDTYLDMLALGPLGSALNAADKGDPGSFLRSHVNTIPSTTWDFVQNKNPATGGEIVPTGTPAANAFFPHLGAAAQHIVPIGISGFAAGNKVPVGQQVFSGISGFRSSAVTPSKRPPPAPVTLESVLHSLTPGYKAPSVRSTGGGFGGGFGRSGGGFGHSGGGFR